MANLKQWLEESADGEAIIGVVIGELGWGDYGAEKVPRYTEQPKGQLLTWNEAAGWLDYDFDDGYGYPGCNAVYAWTESKVISIGEHDGATGPDVRPRNPVACMPVMV